MTCGSWRAQSSERATSRSLRATVGWSRSSSRRPRCARPAPSSAPVRTVNFCRSRPTIRFWGVIRGKSSRAAGSRPPRTTGCRFRKPDFGSAKCSGAAAWSADSPSTSWPCARASRRRGASSRSRSICAWGGRPIRSWRCAFFAGETSIGGPAVSAPPADEPSTTGRLTTCSRRGTGDCYRRICLIWSRRTS